MTSKMAPRILAMSILQHCLLLQTLSNDGCILISYVFYTNYLIHAN
jgi:hypothetical protein